MTLRGSFLKPSLRALAVLVGVAVVLGVASPALVNAEGTANTLKVSPVRSDVSINAGESDIVEVTVTNLTDDAVSVHPSMHDFIAGDEDGTPAIVLDEGESTSTYSMRNFVGELSDVTIPAGESVTVELLITVPEETMAGGYYGALRFSPTTPDGGGQVNLSASVASLVLLTVPGEMVESMTLTDFAVQDNGAETAFFINTEGAAVTFRLENDSNIQMGPFGQISVLRGDELVYTANFNDEAPRDMVLPDSARRWTLPIEGIQDFGHYEITATFTYGQSNQTIEVTRSFWVVPAWVIATTGGAIVLLAGGVTLFFVLRSRNKARRPRRGRSGLTRR